jgi:poly-gamma-glutamate capsule biosynthesis protein CapA/YwtB (metallophosphatase superfamily)
MRMSRASRTMVRPFGLMLIVILLGVFGLQWGEASAADQRPHYPQELGRVTFAVAGDVIPHQAVQQAAAAADASVKETQTSSTTPAPTNDHGGWDALLSQVADVFQQADFGFVNFETPVAPTHSHGTKSFMFNAPLDLVEALKASGVKIVSFANNHVFDQGHEGFNESLEHLREEGMLFAGAGSNAQTAWQPVIVEKNGVKVGWLGMTRWLNGNRNPEKDDEPHVAFLPYPNESGGAPGMDEDGVLAAIKAARAQCDLLIVSIHWGTEYATAPRPEDYDLAHKMLEAGAGAVIGHHPHVLQPVETYQTSDGRNTLIAFSLGNFLSNQSRYYVNGMMPDQTGDPRDSLMVRFAVVKRDYGPGGIRTELADVGLLPAWGENNYLQLRSGRTKVPMIRPVLIDRELPRLQARLDELNKLGVLTAEQRQEFVALTEKLNTLQHRRELLLQRTGDEYLIGPPTTPTKPTGSSR